MKSLILTWQNSETRSWFPVGRLDHSSEGYFFRYTQGANEAKEQGFKPFSRMEKMNVKYQSDNLFPLFSNRTMPKSRPEFLEYSEWFGLDADCSTLDWLAKSGGKKATDSLGVFLIPKERKGKFEMSFFLHGIRYLNESVLDEINSLKSGDKLFLMKDFQNPYDKYALAVRRNGPKALIGYCPRYYTKCFLDLLGGNEPSVILSVSKVNSKAPYDYKLLCKLEASWKDIFEPFSEGDFKPLVE